MRLPHVIASIAVGFIAACTSPHVDLGGQAWDAGTFSVGNWEGTDVLASGSGSPCDLASDDAYLYWTVASDMYRMAKSGGQATVIETGSGAVCNVGGTLFLVDDSYIYWAVDNTVVRAAKDGSDPTVIYQAVNDSIYTLAQDASAIYAIDGLHMLVAISKADQTSRTLVAKSPQNMFGLAIDASYAYVGGQGSRVPLAGGPLEVLDPSSYAVVGGGMVVEGDSLYWGGNPEVMRIPTGGGATTVVVDTHLPNHGVRKRIVLDGALYDSGTVGYRAASLLTVVAPASGTVDILASGPGGASSVTGDTQDLYFLLEHPSSEWTLRRMARTDQSSIDAGPAGTIGP